MGSLAVVLWDALGAAGGSLALSFIVALFVGLVALTLFYLVSAVVVLDRFARAPLGWTWLAAFAALASAFAGGIGLVSLRPELSAQAWGPWLVSWLSASGLAAVPVVLLMGLAWVAIRLLTPERLAQVGVVALGLAVALVLGATDQTGIALAAPAAVGLAALALAARRRRRRRVAGPGVRPGPSPTERLLREFAGILGLGVVLALALPERSEPAWIAGNSLLACFFGFIVLGLLPLAGAGLMGLRGSAEWFIAARYLVAKRRQTFISFITGICVLGVAAGVWLIITVLSVMNGFANTWRDEIIGNRAHFTVHSGIGPFDDWRAVLQLTQEAEGVVAASPYLDAEAMVRGSAGEIMGVRVRGVNAETIGNVTDLEGDMIAGSLSELEPLDPEGDDVAAAPGIVVGHQLAASLGLSVGDPVLLVLPYGGPPTPLGPAPRLVRFRLAGVFESSFFQYDEVYTYVSLAEAQDLRRAGDVVDGIEVRTDDFYFSRRVAERVRDVLGFPYYARDWTEYFPAFFQALKGERVMMSLLLTMIMVVAAFVIVTTLLMMVMEKSGDIAILKTMGAEDGTVERIFAIEGTLIGLAGTLLGVLASVAVTNQLGWIQARIEAVLGFDALPENIYQLSTLPADMDPAQVAIVVAIAMVLALGATLLPSRQGARLDPVEALRYE